MLAISSRALFDLSDSHKVYLAEGVETYRQYQIEHEEEILEPGDAFPLVKKLLSLNASLGRARRLLSYIESRDLIVTRTDLSGKRSIAIPRLGWSTAAA